MAEHKRIDEATGTSTVGTGMPCGASATSWATDVPRTRRMLIHSSPLSSPQS